jgi:hypothetical protein
MSSDKTPTSIRGWKDLEAFGIVYLTGEACNINARLLCDVTKSGKELLESIFGCELVLRPNFNNGKDSDPHIGSILLPKGFWHQIGIFALLQHHKQVYTYASPGWGFGIYAVEADQDRQQIRDTMLMQKNDTIVFYGINDSVPHVGTTNVHMASGRSMGD